MIDSFPINFIQATFEQVLLEEHLKNPNFFGGRDQVCISSFYQQLKNQEDLDRFIATFEDLAKQQNRLSLIGNAILMAPENPTITNLYNCNIIPMEWICSMRCNLENRDEMLITLNNLIEQLKGRKVDIAQLNCINSNGSHYGQPFVVGVIGENDGKPELKDGDYFGSVANAYDKNTIISYLISQGITLDTTKDYYLYCENDGKLKVMRLYLYNQTTWEYTLVSDDGTIDRIIFPPEHESFDKYKLSFSFEALRCDTPNTLNSKKYCEISFGGSATLVNNGVQLGNDLLKISITKLGIPADTPIDFSQEQNNPTYWLEPLEMPSGSNVNTEINQLISNKFLVNTHSDALALTLQYSFIADFNIPLLKQLFKYARYGTQGITKNDISPNMIFSVSEIWCSWGEFEKEDYKAKIVENIDIENSESDTLTLGITFQLQGDNN